jgi:hypothetical protein
MARPVFPLLITIPGDIDPIERGERFERAVNRALREDGQLGRVTGGGTSLCLGGRRFVTGCHLDVDVQDVGRALPALRRALLAAAAPRGTRVLHAETAEVLLVSAADGTFQPPRRRTRVPDYPWAEGEVLGYRLAPDVLALLYVVEGGRHPVFRVPDWSGPAVPPAEAVRALLARRERRYALGGRLYAVGWRPMSLRAMERLPGRLDEARVERTGLVVPLRRGYVRGRICAFGQWAEFHRQLRQWFGLEPMTARERLMADLGIGSLADHFAVWSASGPVTPARAYELLAAYVRKDPGRPAIPPTDALRQFVRDLRGHFDRRGEGDRGPPWANPFRAAEGFMIIPTYATRTAEVRRVVSRLARAHGLTAYDPQAGEVFVRPPVSVRRARS